MSSRRRNRRSSLNFSHVAIAFALLAVATCASAGVATSQTAEKPATVTELYPDTYQQRDAGEYVTVEFGAPTDTTGWALEDGSRTTEFPNRTLDGTIHFSDDVPPVEGDHDRNLRLSNDGETVRLRDGSGAVVDEVRYGDEGGVEPDEGEILVRDGPGATEFDLCPLGGTHLEPLRTNVSGGTAFAVPDAGGVVADEFASAEERVLVSAFTFGSEYLGERLEETSARVSVLVEGTPPGGFGAPTEQALDGIADAADVYVAEGDKRRYMYFHAKYAVIDDDSSVVTSENWGDRNFGPNASGSRGWGVVVEDGDTADYLTQVFETDVDWRSVSAWENASVDSHKQRDSEAKVETGFDARSFEDAPAEVFVAPDAGVEPVVSLIEGADDEVLVQQSYIRPWGDDNLSTNPYVEALEERAEAGVDVRVLLDGRWYYEEENAEVAEALNGSDSDVEARVAERPVHTKGVVVDNESVLVSSTNWNQNSPTNNREVGIILHDEDAAGYFAEVFESDWDYEGEESGGDGDEAEGAVPSDYVLEIAIIVLVSGIGVWLVTREM